jgi:hypothetical protein
MVMQATRFLGPSKEYENAWGIPAEVQLIKLPRDNDELVRFAREEHGIEPRTGEKWGAFRRRVEDSI